MKIFLGILIGVGLTIGGVAMASRAHGIIFASDFITPSGGYISKIYDQDNGVVCYTYIGQGISCLHN